MNIHPNALELINEMQRIGNGTLEVKVQDGIPQFITREIQSVNLNERVRRKKELPK